MKMRVVTPCSTFWPLFFTFLKITRGRTVIYQKRGPKMGQKMGQKRVKNDHFLTTFFRHLAYHSCKFCKKKGSFFNRMQVVVAGFLSAQLKLESHSRGVSKPWKLVKPGFFRHGHFLTPKLTTFLHHILHTSKHEITYFWPALMTQKRVKKWSKNGKKITHF